MILPPFSTFASPGGRCLARIEGLLLLTRPYSWLDAALTGVVGVWSASGSARAPAMAAGAVVAWLLWCGFNLYSDRVQEDPGRPCPPAWLIWSCVAIAAGTAVVFGGVIALLPIAAFVGVMAVYPYKALTPVLGPLGPVMRGLQTVLLVLVGSMLVGSGTRVDGQLLAGFFLVQVARSLVADVRDVDRDRFELPKRIGIFPAWVGSMGLLAWGIAVLPMGRPAFPLIVELVVLAAVGAQRAYEAHALFVLAFTLQKLWLLDPTLGPGVTIALGMLALVMLSTYWKVPRSANEAFRRRWAWGAREG